MNNARPSSDAATGRRTIVVLVRVGVREQRREDQRLRDDLGIRVARVPCLNDVYAKQTGRRGRRKRPDQAPAREIHGQYAENRPPRDHPASARDAI